MKWLLPKRSRIKARLEIGDEVPYIKFDESTGQIYSETTATIPTSDDRDWYRDSRIVKRAKYLDVEQYNRYVKKLDNGRASLARHQKGLNGLKNSRIRGFKGARSLQHAATECILKNISDITLEGIECLPISVVRRLWHAVITRCSMSFSIWSIFSKVLRQSAEYLDLLKYHEAIEFPNCPLGIYIDPLISVSYDFLTSLSITSAFPVPDLMKLSAVTNLAALEIINTIGVENTTVGDRLLRAWHLSAVEIGAFAVLRVLRLWKHEGLTEKSLTYLNGFPALAVYDVRGCSFAAESMIEATRIGWKAVLEINILAFLEKICAERAILMRAKLGIEGASYPEIVSEHLWDGAKVRRIPRADVPMFLAKVAVLNGSPDDNGAHESEAETDAPKVEESPRHLYISKAKASQTHRSERQSTTWDLVSYKCIARIGELRNDNDFAKAGIVLGDQAIIGDDLVNSLPVVSLRLGSFPSWLESSLTGDGISAVNNSYGWVDKPQLATSSLQGLAFVRIKTCPQHFLSHGGIVDSSNGIRACAGNKFLSKQKPPRRREASELCRKKRRKLDDALNSFL